MNADNMRQLVSTVRSNGTLELALAQVEIPRPQSDEVLVRVEAAPINPSDLLLMFGAADLATATAGGSAEAPTLTACIPEASMASVSSVIDRPMPLGNEGAGVVVSAGASGAARRLLGRTVAMFGGAMYAQYRCVPVAECLLLPPGTPPRVAASSFVNPLTALAMVGTMRLEGHRALVHTAAASNLGQMLNRLCQEEEVPLVNIVRRPDQAALLRDAGASWVVDSSRATFLDDLTDSLAATGATLAFDAVGGGELAGQILGAMEAAIGRAGGAFNRYGSAVHKQVYLYGGLDFSPTVLQRNFGMAWGIGGWLLSQFLAKVGPDAAAALRERVAAGIRTTFASHFSGELSLAEALSLKAIGAYAKRATGEKFLINPNR